MSHAHSKPPSKHLIRQANIGFWAHSLGLASIPMTFRGFLGL